MTTAKLLDIYVGAGERTEADLILLVSLEGREVVRFTLTPTQVEKMSEELVKHKRRSSATKLVEDTWARLHGAEDKHDPTP